LFFSTSLLTYFMDGSTLASAGEAAGAERGGASYVSPAREAWQRFRRHKLAVGSGVVLILLVLAIAFGPLVWSVSIRKRSDMYLKGPSPAHPLGTDDMGHDLLARMFYGGRISLAVGLTAMVVGVLIGALVGAVAGMSRSLIDTCLMWVTDLFLSLPQLPLLLLVVYLFRDPVKKLVGPEAGAFILIVSVVGGFRWMTVARLVRAQFLSLREKKFVEAARALGASKFRLVVNHILPNALGPVIVTASIDVANAIVAESTLSFLGLGFPPDTPTWGGLLSGGKDFLDLAPHWALFPGAAIFVAVLSINFVGDGLRDMLDPRRVL
jgi:peptide/nickel transport system permease protein